MWPVADTTRAISAAHVREISFPFGPELYTPDSAYIPEVETNRFYRSVQSFSITHEGYVALPLPNVIAATLSQNPSTPARRTVLTYWAVEIGGVNWTGMPSGGNNAAVLHRDDGISPFPLSVTDPAASVSDMNSIRRMEQDYSSSPITLTQNGYMLELQSCKNGTGSSREARFYRAIVRLAEVTTIGGVDYYVGPGE
jgi:hypothetical protein